MDDIDDLKGLLISSVPEGEKVGRQKFAYAMLLSYVKKTPIKDKKELSRMIKEEIGRCNNWLVRNKTFATASKEQREFARKMQYLLAMRRLVRKYL